MTNEEKNAVRNEKAQPDELPLVVEIFPGTADRGYVIPLGNDYRKSISGILDEAIRQEPRNRELKSVQDVLKTEYTDKSKILVEGKTASRDDTLDKYLSVATEDETPGGKHYRLLKIRVAKPQEGGLRFY